MTNNVTEVCDFLCVPYFCLDGKTRMSSQDIFNVLTACKLFFNNNDYDQKYKLKERKKGRPVSTMFFNALEGADNSELKARNAIKFQTDKVYTILHEFKCKQINFEEYVERISDCFGKKECLIAKWAAMKEQKQTVSNANLKFNYYILKEWYPIIDQVRLGKIFATLKNPNNRTGSTDFEKWILETDIAEIRKLADETVKDFETC